MPLALGAAAALLLALLTAPARGAAVLIVRASDAEPYAQAEAALKSALSQAHHDVRTMLAKDVSDKGVAASVGKSQVVVAIGTSAARWLHKQLPPEARLVYCMVGSVDDAALEAGADCWGVTTEVPLAQQIALIAETLPRVRVIGLLYRSHAPDSRRCLERLKQAVPADWRVEGVAVDEFSSTADAIEALRQKNPQLIWTSADARLYDTATVRALLLSAMRSKTPMWGYSPAFVRAGALIGVGIEPRTQAAQAAEVTLQVLSGKATAAEKGQPPKQFQIAINLIVAQQMGVDVPPALISRAAFVYRPEN